MIPTIEPGPHGFLTRGILLRPLPLPGPGPTRLETVGARGPASTKSLPHLARSSW